MTYADTSYYEGEWLGGKRVTGKLLAGELARVRVRVTVQGAQMLVINSVTRLRQHRNGSSLRTSRELFSSLHSLRLLLRA